MNVTILHPGVFYETPEQKNKKSIESLVRAEMRRNGYPTTSCYDAPCTQPDICDKLVDCVLPGAGCVTNGLTIYEDPNCIGLGGTLGLNTVINTATFDFSVVKGDVGVAVMGPGGLKRAEFQGVNGPKSVYSGVRYLGSSVSFISEFYNSTTDLRINVNSDDILERLELFVSKGVNNSYIFITPTTAQIAGAVQMLNLPTYANNAAAVSGGLAVNTLYKTAGGSVNIVV